MRLTVAMIALSMSGCATTYRPSQPAICTKSEHSRKMLAEALIAGGNDPTWVAAKTAGANHLDIMKAGCST